VYESVAVATQPEERVGRRGAAVAIPPLAVLAGERGLTMHAIPAERAAFRSWEV
jgi:methionyl-tRNA formyltransferase